jgi:Undecaprenyl-phosphate glucose phosphotransferase
VNSGFSRSTQSSLGSLSTAAQANEATASPLRRFLIKLAIGEFLLVVAAAYIGSVSYHGLLQLRWPNPTQYLPAALVLAMMVSLVSLGFRHFTAIQTQLRHQFLWNGAGAVALSFSSFLSIMFLLKMEDGYSRGTFLFQLAGVGIALLTLRATAYSRLQSAIAAGKIEARRVVLIGDQDDCSRFARRLRLTGIRTVRAFGFPEDCDATQMPVPTGTPIAPKRLRKLVRESRPLRADDIVILAKQQDLRPMRALAYALSELPVDLHIVPVDAVDLMGSARISVFGDTMTLQVARRPLSPTDRAIKRAFDLVAAAAGLTLFLPLLAMVAIAIKLDSRGPVLFWQTRHGFNNEPIRVAKFRTMSVLEDGDAFRQAVKGDQRITSVGRLLRRSNIDELPQLLNVLRGNMSLIGPRPHATAHNEMFERCIYPFSRRHNVKPGITGWAQVNGYRGETDTLEKMSRRVEYDLYYVDNWSFLFDMKIIVMTLFSKAAYLNAY